MGHGAAHNVERGGVPLRAISVCALIGVRYGAAIVRVYGPAHGASMHIKLRLAARHTEVALHNAARM